MEKITAYGRWILLAAAVLAAGFCYSCGTGYGVTMVPFAQVRNAELTAETTGETYDVTSVGIPDESASPELCFVHVCGEVENPGLYGLAEGSRVYDAILEAGGFTQEAEEDYLNLAEVVQDGMKIVVPDRSVRTETAAGILISSQGNIAAGEISGKININSADRTALMTLNGIGEARADAIIRYRDEHGKFSAIEDIMQVPGIKEAAFQKIKEDIMV